MKKLLIVLLGISFVTNIMANATTCPSLDQIKYKNSIQDEIEIHAQNALGYWSSGKIPKEIKIIEKSTKLFAITDSPINSDKLIFIGAPIGNSHIPALWCIYPANNGEEIFLTTIAPNLLPKPTFKGVENEWSTPREWIFGNSYQLICKKEHGNCNITKLSD